MKSPSSAALLLLGIFGLGVAAQDNNTAQSDGAFTLDQVHSMISSFLQITQNGTANATLNARDSASSLGCQLSCAFLDFTIPGSVSYPSSPVYQFQESRYWSQQQASSTPTCRFSPQCASEVSVAILANRLAQCQFAAKSGGHAAFYGASNINGGMAIDLINLNQITVSADKTQTSIGPGNRWYDVYSKLDPLGLSVIGGRVADIGVGGLTLGGGISFFSGRYGWACDNVNTYQLVTADGAIREVTSSTYPDLYFALRGGGNNFGIVTRLDLKTFPQGNLWAGSETFIYNPATATALNNAFYNMNINGPSDPYAAVILAYAYVASFDTYVIASDLQYGLPIANPPILKNFTAVPGAIASTLRVTNLSALTVEFNNSNPGGYRQTYWALMVKNSPSLMADIIAIYQDETNKVKDAANITSSCIFQPITLNQISHFSENGGNALGISTSDGPLNLINIDISWFLSSDDTRILAAARNIVNRSNATAYAQGLGHPFIYQNYAAQEQAVFPSYGQRNYQQLKSTARKWDPSGVWEKLQPGYFKL